MSDGNTHALMEYGLLGSMAKVLKSSNADHLAKMGNIRALWVSPQGVLMACILFSDRTMATYHINDLQLVQ
jgi:hypothetical protein